MGIVFLNEALSIDKVAGAVLTITAGLLILGKFKSKENFKGLLYAFVPTFVYAAIITLYSVLFNKFNTASLTFFIFLVPAIANWIIMPGSNNRILTFLKRHPVFVIISGCFAGFGNLAMNEAFKVGEQGRVIILLEVFAVVLVASEYFILKEKEKPVIKIIALILAIIGGVLVKIG